LEGERERRKEGKKLKDVGFIREEQHLDWLANIVPVTKKNGKILPLLCRERA